MIDDEDERERDADEEEDPIELLDELMRQDGSALPPISPDGGFAPQPIAGEPAPIPEATVENMICMAGPCEHYIEMESWFPSGNVEGSPGYDARESVRYCDRLRSAHISLTDELVFKCSAWRPICTEEKAQREKDRGILVEFRAKGQNA